MLSWYAIATALHEISSILLGLSSHLEVLRDRDGADLYELLAEVYEI
jgi:hypothetical protein